MKQTHFELVQLSFEVGTSGILGFIMGYGTKKFVKLAAVIIGLELALIKFLEAEGIIMDVRWDTINRTVAEMNLEKSVSGRFLDSLMFLPVGSGFAIGAGIGFKKG